MLSQLDAVESATPLLRIESGKTSLGRIHPMGPYDMPYAAVYRYMQLRGVGERRAGTREGVPDCEPGGADVGGPVVRVCADLQRGFMLGGWLPLRAFVVVHTNSAMERWEKAMTMLPPGLALDQARNAEKYNAYSARAVCVLRECEHGQHTTCKRQYRT